MRPGIAERASDETTAVPVQVWKSGRMWWPEGRLPGVYCSRKGYEDSVPPEDHGTLKAGWEQLWREGQSVVDHTLLIKGRRMRVRLKLHTEKSAGTETASGILRLLGDEAFTPPMPDVYPLFMDMCSRLTLCMERLSRGGCTDQGAEKRLAEKIIRRMRRLSRRVETVLTLGEVQPLRLCAFDPRFLLQQLETALAPSLTQRGMLLHTECEDPPVSSDGMVVADQSQAARCLREMMVCAIHRSRWGASFVLNVDSRDGDLLLELTSAPIWAPEELLFLRTGCPMRASADWLDLACLSACARGNGGLLLAEPAVLRCVLPVEREAGVWTLRDGSVSGKDTLFSATDIEELLEIPTDPQTEDPEP